LSSGFIQYTNLAAFTLPATRDASGNLLGPFGNASRNPGRTPAFYQINLSLNKKFNTPVESLKVEFRSEAYNVFNQPIFICREAVSAGLSVRRPSSIVPPAAVRLRAPSNHASSNSD
jgi:hypothetical protein